MKAILHHIAKKNVTKRVARSTAQSLADFLREEGYTKHGRVFSKGKHQYVFNGKDHHWAISYRKVDRCSGLIPEYNTDLDVIPQDDPRHIEILEKLGLTEVTA